MFVYDFTPVAQTFEVARRVLSADAGSVVADAIRSAARDDGDSADLRVDVGPPREREEAVAITLAWGQPLRPVPPLEGDLELAPLGPGLCHLSLSANYRPDQRDLGRRIDQQRERRSTEALVREFLVRVARKLEHTDEPPRSTARQHHHH